MKLQWRYYSVFKRIRYAYWSLWILIVAGVVTFMAEMVANNRPLILKYHDRWFFPVFITYQGEQLGPIEEIGTDLEPNYKTLKLTEDDFALWPPLHWGDNETNENINSYPSPPSRHNLLGTDDRGRDLLTRLIYGYRMSFVFGLCNLLLAIFIAVIVGGIQGYVGGLLDLIGQRFIEVWNALPYLYVLILIVNVFQPSLTILITVNAAFVWISLSYYVRAEYLSLRKKDFVLAARALGANWVRIIFRHILPNSMTPIVTFSPFILSLSIYNLAILDYLGLGVPAPTASIGELLRQGRNHFITSWWLAVYPFFVLVTMMITLNFVGEGVREVYDPRKGRRR